MGSVVSNLSQIFNTWLRWWSAWLLLQQHAGMPFSSDFRILSRIVLILKSVLPDSPTTVIVGRFDTLLRILARMQNWEWRRDFFIVFLAWVTSIFSKHVLRNLMQFYSWAFLSNSKKSDASSHAMIFASNSDVFLQVLLSFKCSHTNYLCFVLSITHWPRFLSEPMTIRSLWSFMLLSKFCWTLVKLVALGWLWCFKVKKR